ncbi:GAF domain-containing protein [Salinigranum rubrum]|uniref:GAF domain-containing protein n=1 Tax=Salinigranum rubrum TaxID=755307 RepID=UPI0013A53CEB|nr:GAF domain-containing protein [Salinigranum rubrum]
MTETAVLCVDADERERERTTAALSAVEGLVPTPCGSVEVAVRLLASEPFDCLVTDYALPDGTGLDVVAAAREVRPDIGCVLFTDTPFADIDTGETPHAVVDHLTRESEADYEYLPRLVQHVATARTHASYPLPSNESERVAALAAYDLDGLTAIDSFDRLTALASRQFEVSFAFVGLVDAHEERFLACYGAEWDALSREDTICTYAILEDDVTVVEDVADDPRFAANEVLSSRGIRSYAGATLETPAGEPVGMFCVLDDEPRSYTEDERESLRLFAAEAAEQLELRRRLSATGGCT